MASISISIILLITLIPYFSTQYKYENKIQKQRRLQEQRPTMHTFFEYAYDKTGDPHKKMLLELEQWRTAWMKAGWRTMVLTMRDAERHPLFSDFQKAFDEARYPVSNYDRMCFYRWLAMAATSDGGWMSDYDTMPLYSNPIESLIYPNGGQFTSFQKHVPSLIVANPSEWNRMAALMYEYYISHGDSYYNDMRALLDIQMKTKSCVFEHEMNVIDIHTVYSKDIKNEDPIKIHSPVTPINYLDVIESHLDEFQNNNVIFTDADPFVLQHLCHKLEGIRAIHFSHSACEKVGFCDGMREIAVGKWIQMFHEQCVQGK